MTAICFKTRKPIIYNENTQYETSRDTFLAYYTFKSVEEAQREADELNQSKPAKLFNGVRIDWNDVDFYFAKEQGEMY